MNECVCWCVVIDGTLFFVGNWAMRRGGDQAAQPPQIRCALFCAAIDEGGRLVEV